MARIVAIPLGHAAKKRHVVELGNFAVQMTAVTEVKRVAAEVTVAVLTNVAGVVAVKLGTNAVVIANVAAESVVGQTVARLAKDAVGEDHAATLAKFVAGESSAVTR